MAKSKSKAAKPAKKSAKAGKPAAGAPNPNFIAWNTGDYLTVGAAFQLMSEQLCEAVDLHCGQKVLDVAGGTGNAAIAAARRWCKVTGTDLIPYMVEAAKARAKAEGLDVDFRVADAQKLPFDDNEFDVVLSAIGVMFAPNQDKCASELLRVCKPGGKIGLTCWTPTSSVAAMSMAIGKHLPPPPPGFMPPVAWGAEQRLRQMFGARASSMHIALRTHYFKHPTPAGYVEYVKENYGPTALAFKMMGKETAQKVTDEIVAQITATNISGDSTLVVPGEYAEIVIVKAA
jgi:ubiquinone/menaquinone biosynthesis C-methylase UbiE